MKIPFFTFHLLGNKNNMPIFGNYNLHWCLWVLAFVSIGKKKELDTSQSSFPKVDNSGNYARIVLEQNIFSEKIRTQTLDTMTVVFPIQLC